MTKISETGKREDILRAARILFKQKGYSETSIASIATKAKVAYGTVYVYFRSKSAIVEALCEDYLAKMAEILYSAVDVPEDTDIVRSAVHASLTYASENNDLVRLLDLHMSMGLQNVRPKADLKIQCILGRKIAEMVIKGKARQCDPSLTAELVGGFIEWITKACFVWSKLDVTHYEEAAIQMLRYALLVDPGRD